MELVIINLCVTMSRQIQSIRETFSGVTDYWRPSPDDPEPAVDGVKSVAGPPRPFTDPETDSDDENDKIESIPTIVLVRYPVPKLLPHRVVIVVCDLRKYTKEYNWIVLVRLKCLFESTNFNV